MSTDQKNQNNLKEKDDDESQSQINNGNIGREPGVENEEPSVFSSDGRLAASEKPANEQGVAENEENHWSGNHGQKSSNRPVSSKNEYTDQNLNNAVQQNKGANHITNAGGTSQEDLEKGKTGLKEETDSD